MLHYLVPAVAAVLFAAPDELALVWEQPQKPKAQNILHVHELAEGAGSVGTVQAADGSFLKWGGNSPVRHVFSADWNGDGQDEIVLVREHLKKKDKRLVLTVHPAPKGLGGQSSKVLASSKGATLGVAVGDNRIVGVGAADVDGDGVDELVTIHERTNGERSQIVRAFPPKKNKPMGFPLRSDFSFGTAADGEIVSVSGAELDQSDSSDEFLVLYRGPAGVERLDAHEAPPAPFSEAGPVLWSTTSVLATDGALAENVYEGLITNSQLIPVVRLGIVRRGADGVARIDMHALPQAPGFTFAAPIASTPLPTLPNFDVELRSALLLGKPLEYPWDRFSGPWSCRYRIGYTKADGTIVFEWIGPIPGFTMGIDASKSYALDTPGSPSKYTGNLSAWTSGASVTISAAPLTYNVTKKYGIVLPGEKIIIAHTPGTLLLANGKYAFGGANAFGFSIGEVHTATGQLRAAIMEYQFTQ